MTSGTNTKAATGELRFLDPHQLQIDTNIRTAAALDKDFLASIKLHGVLVPIVSVDGSDEVRVRHGQRRTLAAIEGDRDLVPVYVTHEDAADEVARIVTQWAENEHRAGLTTSDKVAAVEQLAAFGLTSSQIAKRTSTRRADVNAALATARSELAKASTSRYGFLTLDQAAAVAEFEEDTETVTALVAAARDGGFDHVVQRARDDRARRDAEAAMATDLADSGVRVVNRPTYSEQSIKTLRELATAPDGDQLEPKKHPTCPGHVAWIGSDWRGARIEYGCDQWQAQGHHDLTALPGVRSGPMNDAEKAERAETVENNKAWRAAETVRRDWLTILCQRRTPPKDSAAYVARQLLAGGYDLRRAMERPDLLRTMIGVKDGDLTDSAAKVTDGRAQTLSLAFVLSAQEQATSVSSWRSVDTSIATYLNYLAELGYELAPIEKKAAGITARGGRNPGPPNSRRGPGRITHVPAFFVTPLFGGLHVAISPLFVMW